MRQKPSKLRQNLQWIAFIFIWLFWIASCFTTFLAFEVVLGLRAGGFIGNKNLTVFNQKIPVKHSVSAVFAGLIEVGSLLATSILLKKREEGEVDDTKYKVTLQKEVSQNTKALLTIGQTFIFALTLSSTLLIGGGQPNGYQEFNPNPSQSTQIQKTQNPLLEDPLLIALIIFLSPTGAVIMTWVIPEWALKITQMLIDTDETNN